MSDEPKRWRRKWLSLALAALIVLSSYFAVHRATGPYDWYVESDALGHPKARIHRQHWLKNRPLPRWVESFFRPASQFDDFVGYSPERPSCILMPTLNSRANRQLLSRMRPPDPGAKPQNRDPTTEQTPMNAKPDGNRGGDPQVGSGSV
jgi:hypothetical protein